MISLLQIDTVVILDLETETVVWALTGLWHRQHDAHLTQAGTLLAFDNQHRASASAVTEIDPFTQQRLWVYDPGDLYSRVLGATSRLANGNTLIVESTRGHALEVTPAGEVVWAWWSPHRAGSEQQYVAAVFDVVRVEEPLPWLVPH